MKVRYGDLTLDYVDLLFILSEQSRTKLPIPMPPHFDLTVSSATLDQVLGFLAAKGFAVDFDAREYSVQLKCCYLHVA